jgi:hypothetical protein
MATADTSVLAGAGTGGTATAESDKPEVFTKATVSESENSEAERAESEESTTEQQRDEL